MLAEVPYALVVELSGFYPSTFLQSVNGSKNSILNSALKLSLFKSLQVFFFFFVCLSEVFPSEDNAYKKLK